MKSNDVKIVYKVFSVTEAGDLVSSVTDGPLAVHYPVRRWSVAHPIARRRGYHLLAFRDWNSGSKFAANVAIFRPTQLWECEAMGVTEMLPRMGIMFILTPIASSKLLIQQDPLWPHGTIMAEKIRPIRMLNSY